MIPLTVANEVQATLIDYLRTTFNFQDDALDAALTDFMQAELFKGPYVSLRLPFRKVSQETPIPLEIAPAFTPYVHQRNAFQRLTSLEGHAPQPTLVTTGTGSGKTECFLYPILDHCYRLRSQRGIKAIILYPMNALAADQAGRLAEAIWQESRLRGQVSAGVYIGGEAKSQHKSMGPNWLIDDRETLRQSPPDILLTNYRMLDFLLLRPEDKALWAQNSPETLRYLVLDELHTYDGAQGSDVAGLIRRLKARLATPTGFLCPVGTSATIATAASAEEGEMAENPLLTFACDIFGEPFDKTSIIGENRLTLAEFLDQPSQRFALPSDLDALPEKPGESDHRYLQRLASAWFADLALPLATQSTQSDSVDPLRLANCLKEHSFLRAVLFATRGGVVALDQLLHGIARQDPEFASQPAQAQERLLESFLALIAHARVAAGSNEKPRLEPLLTLQVQMWVRELSRLMRKVAAQPAFFWRDDVPEHAASKGLPAYVCRECGHSGWLALKRDEDLYLNDNTTAIYQHYFERSRHICYLYPGERIGEFESIGEHLCPQCLKVGHHPRCADCQIETMPVVLHRALSKPAGANRAPADLQRCPICDADDALSIVGSQAASLLSVAISHLFTSPLNRDKKLLAFNDSVQDAAHRAAFFGARTYRFNLRTAIQSALDEAQQQPIYAQGVPLDRMTDHLIDCWRKRWQPRPDFDQRLAASFLPPDLADLNSYRAFMSSTPAPMPANLESDLRKRLSWEVVMEYGFNARLGRSLEKVGSSTAYFNQEMLQPAVEKLHLILSNEIGLLRNLTLEQMGTFLTGLLDRTRTRGGVAHPLLKRYCEEQGNWYLLTKRIQPLLSPFYKRSPRFPRFLVLSSHRNVFDPLLTSGSGRSWYMDWAQRSLHSALGLAEINDLYRQVLVTLSQAQLLHEYRQGNDSAYGLRQEALLITTYTVSVRCSHCNQQQSVAQHEAANWLGSPCLSYQCRGRYQPDTREQQQYYRVIYEQGQVERIFTHEHTGLLQREVREAVEDAFSNQPRADSVNLLSATPTLEMGIDIGDLSATMACSVPPTAANYLQRIGRAGRKTGNSWIFTMATGRAHDLYFYADPLQMIAGEVEPPGCFLNAPSMLQRQFLAFCMDRWTQSHAGPRDLPRNVQTLLAGVSRGQFPENFLKIYEGAKSALLEEFLALYGSAVHEENQQLLRNYAQGDDLPQAIRRALQAVAAERDALRTSLRDLQKEQKRVADDPAQFSNPQERILELKRESKLLLDLLRALDEQYILNFLTDASLLPNYAFPESGVKLRAVISGLPTEQEDEPTYEVHEYVRSAATALKELAPFNSFYAERRKLIVDRVEISGRDKALERWQFCDRCGYLELVQTSHYRQSCPACGSPRWSDLGQQHEMVRMRQVISTSSHYDSLLSDDSEDREREGYQTRLFFATDSTQSSGAHIIPSLPFGFEHFQQVTLREVNFGRNEAWGQRIQIADEEQSAIGFRLCKDCGAAIPLGQNEVDPKAVKHAFSCVSKSGGSTSDVYLYREMVSEALRILLPVSTTLVEEKLTTFAAVLQLGMRLHLGGDPDHLQIAPYNEVGFDGVRRRYLMIYDTVPGGTSYLHDLAHPQNLRAVLQHARQALASCECRNDPDKPACYRCLYSYRGQSKLALISRQAGLELVQEILAEWEKLQAAHTLSEADLQSVLESELEQRFVDALELYAKAHSNCRWQPTMHNGKQGWIFTIDGQRWRIEPQVLLGPNQGVALASRADFVFWSLAGDGETTRPLAIFTDGYAFHVRPGEARGTVADDLRKRQALVQSGRFWVWSLSWDDVAEFAEPRRFDLAPFFDPKSERVVQGMVPGFPAKVVMNNGVQQLLTYLASPQYARWQRLAQALSVATMLPPRPPVAESLLQAQVDALRSQPEMPELSMPTNAASGSLVYGITNHHSNLLLAFLPGQSLNQQKFDDLQLWLRLDDSATARRGSTFPVAWRWFLILRNLLQFAPGFNATTTEHVVHFVESSQPAVSASAAAIDEPQAELSSAWQEALKYADPECKPLLMQSVADALPPPLVGYELAASDGRVVAMAELAWSEQQIACFLAGQEDEQKHFATVGWQVFSVTDIEKIVPLIAKRD